MRDLLELAVTDVQSLTLRSVAGAGDQAELTIQTRRGALVLRLLPRGDTSIRLTDLRKRDKRRRGRAKPLAVPFAALTR